MAAVVGKLAAALQLNPKMAAALQKKFETRAQSSTMSLASVEDVCALLDVTEPVDLLRHVEGGRDLAARACSSLTPRVMA